ncbi:MAG: hypothetical protein Q6356_003540 [Candidatus Wukongarchaeota archaeon]|nr:hypothetical protein [Candidatus Wukongarchaeota archaeon]
MKETVKNLVKATLKGKYLSMFETIKKFYGLEQNSETVRLIIGEHYRFLDDNGKLSKEAE